MAEEKLFLDREIEAMIQRQRLAESALKPSDAAPGALTDGPVTLIPHTTEEPEDTLAVRSLTMDEAYMRGRMEKVVEELVGRVDRYARLFKPWSAFMDSLDQEIIDNYPQVVERLRARYAKATVPSLENWGTRVLMDTLGLHDGLDGEISDND